MKRCPTCRRTYAEDAPDYCPSDGMRLMKETAAGFDPESTVLSSGLRVPTPVLPERPQPQSPPEPHAPSTPEPPQAVTPYYPAGDAAGQQTLPPPPMPPPQPVTQPPPPAPQFTPQNWSPPQPPPQPAQPWANQYPGPMPTTPIAPLANAGRIEALAVAALVTGCCAVTIMVAFVAMSPYAVLKLMLVLSILGLGLGVTALILSLQKPSRFGGIPLAIAGLATGTAALVYYFTL